MPGQGIGISPFLRRNAGGGSSGPPTSSNATVQAWLDKIGLEGYTYPSQAKVDIYTDAFDYADTESLTGEFDLLGLLKVENEDLCKIPFIHSGGAAKRFTLDNSPVFTANVGLKGNGLSARLLTSWTQSVDGSQFALNNGSFGNHTNYTLEDVASMGSLGLSETVLYNYFSGIAGGAVQDGSLAGAVGAAVATAAGLTTISLKTNVLKIFRDGVEIYSGASGYTATLDNIEEHVLSQNGTGGSYLGNIQFFYYGSADIDQNKLNTFVNLLLL